MRLSQEHVLSGYRTGTEAAVFLAVLAAGYALEQAVAARTGRQVLRRNP